LIVFGTDAPFSAVPGLSGGGWLLFDGVSGGVTVLVEPPDVDVDGVVVVSDEPPVGGVVLVSVGGVGIDVVVGSGVPPPGMLPSPGLLPVPPLPLGPLPVGGGAPAAVVNVWSGPFTGVPLCGTKRSRQW
jgi:hypothetical protein